MTQSMILCLQIKDSVVKVYSMCGLLHLSSYCFHFILSNPLRVDSKYVGNQNWIFFFGWEVDQNYKKKSDTEVLIDFGFILDEGVDQILKKKSGEDMLIWIYKKNSGEDTLDFYFIWVES